ncbi:hypothetical protein N7486_005820 [Penicillium sp. IBT 16267x]|nr:hypothetical protein N7486_005820 [Penicillium sp. IBT 16267x]
MDTNNLIVLTGATGFLGFKTLTVALEAGYSVRIVVRSAGKVDKVFSSPSIKALNPSSGKLSYVVVPDIAVAGAYDEAVKGATYVIHCASPIPSFGGETPTADQFEERFVQTSRRATIGMLESIRKAGTVKRAIFTSSVVGNIPFKEFLGQGDNNAYSASKAAALNDSETWVKENRPDFDLISILPGFIFGRDELCTTTDDFKSGSTNSVLLGLLQGAQSSSPLSSNAVLVDDIARLHVSALDPKIEGNQAFVATADGVDGMVWEDAIGIVKKQFPHAVADGRLRTTGKQSTVVVRVDGRKTEETFGIKLSGFEHQVKSLVTQYLQVTEA